MPWPSRVLSEVLDPRTRTPEPRLVADGTIKIVSKIAFADGAISLRSDGRTRTPLIQVEPGDLVLSGINALKGAIGIFEEGATSPIAATIHYSAYGVRESLAEPRYLWWLFRSDTFRRRVRHGIHGGIKTELKPRFLLDLEVPLPPLSRQRTILRRIESLARLTSRAKALSESIQTSATALVLSTENSVLSESSSRQIPTVALKDLCEAVVDCDHRTPPYLDAGIPLMRPRDVRNGYLELANTVRISREDHEDRCTRIRPSSGDIVYSRELSFGNAGMIPKGVELSLGQGTILLRPNRSRVHPPYLLWVLNSNIVRSQAAAVAKGAAHPHVNVRDIEVFQLPLPSLQHQQRVLPRLMELQDRVNRISSSVGDIRDCLEALYRSYPDRLLEGPASNLVPGM